MRDDLDHDVRRPRIPPGTGKYQRLAKLLAGWFIRLYCRMKVRGTEHIPAEGPVIIAANHRSMWDVPIHGVASPRPVTFMAKKLVELGYGLVATRGTARFLARNGVRCREVFKVHEGRPHVVDLIENGEIQLVLNTPLGRVSEYDEKAIRERALSLGVPVITTVAGALAAVSGLEALRRGPLEVAALQEGR